MFYDLVRKKSPIPDVEDPVNYLFGMAIIIIKRHLESKRTVYYPGDVIDNYPDNHNTSTNEDEFHICLESIEVLMKQLPGAYAEIIDDFWLKGKSLSDICRERNYKSLKTLSSMKSQALRALLKLIEECDNHHELKFWLKRMENNNENDKKQ